MKLFSMYAKIPFLLILFCINAEACENVLRKNLSTKPHRYGVILAGGGGKRLWPLSKQAVPKQFIKFINERTLLEDTIERTRSLASLGNFFVSTTHQHLAATRYLEDQSICRIIVEPESRNTGPAILFTVMKIYEEDPEAVIFFVPSDHYISDDNLFMRTLNNALDYATSHNEIVLLGIAPNYAATQYGYIECGDQLAGKLYKVKKFHEKPAKEVAEAYLKAGNMLWNAGMFCGKASVFLNEFEKWAPEIMQPTLQYFLGEKKFSEIPDTSFDVAVLEKTDKCAVIRAHFDWSDVGNLEQFIKIRQSVSDNASKVVLHNAQNNLVDVPDKLIVLIDVNDLCVLEANNVLLISHRKKTDSVKEILESLKHNGHEQYM